MQRKGHRTQCGKLHLNPYAYWPLGDARQRIRALISHSNVPRGGIRSAFAYVYNGCQQQTDSDNHDPWRTLKTLSAIDGPCSELLALRSLEEATAGSIPAALAAGHQCS